MGKSHKKRHRSDKEKLDELHHKIRKLEKALEKEKQPTSSRRSSSVDRSDADKDADARSSSVDRSDADKDADASGSAVGSIIEQSTLQEENIGVEVIPAQTALQEMSGDKENTPPLDEEVLKILGENTSSLSKDELSLHAELACRWDNWTRAGLKKEDRKELLAKYVRKGNCLLEAPILNPEIDASITETVKRRDKFLAIDQNLGGSGLSALGSAISLLLCEKEEGVDRMQLLQYLLDSGKLQCELYYQLSKTRRAYIYPGLDNKAKALLEKAPTDEFLFGSSLTDRLKNAQSVEKVGLALKTKPVEKKAPFRPSVNWKGPPARQGYPQAGYKQRVGQKGFHQQPRAQREKIPQSYAKGQPQNRWQDQPVNPPPRQ